MVKNRKAFSLAANQTRENFAAVTTRTNADPVWVQAQNCSLSGGRLHSEANTGLEGDVCVAVGNDDGIGRKPPVFLKLSSIAKDSHSFKNYPRIVFKTMGG